MRTLTEQLAQYAKYHRDPRNIATHFVGIPMIVLAIAVLLSRPSLEVFGLVLTPALLVIVVSVMYYIKLDLSLGVLMGALLLGAYKLALLYSGGALSEWLAWGIGLFVVGWVFQFVGHYYEGKKPAFVDDIMGLVIGPLFVVAEVLFMIGARKTLHADIVAIAGEVRSANNKASV